MYVFIKAVQSYFKKATERHPLTTQCTIYTVVKFQMCIKLAIPVTLANVGHFERVDEKGRSKMVFFW